MAVIDERDEGEKTVALHGEAGAASQDGVVAPSEQKGKLSLLASKFSMFHQGSDISVGAIPLSLSIRISKEFRPYDAAPASES